MPLSPNEVVILVVDDEVVVRNLVQRVLAREGYTVLSSTDGVEGLQVFRHFAEAIHVVVTDIEMPGLDGFALAAQIRIEKPQTKIIFMSGKLEAAETKPSPFLAKPFHTRLLLETVRDMLGEIPMTDSSRASAEPNGDLVS